MLSADARSDKDFSAKEIAADRHRAAEIVAVCEKGGVHALAFMHVIALKGMVGARRAKLLLGKYAVHFPEHFAA